MNYLLKNSNFEERRKNGRKKIFIIIVILIFLSLIIVTTPVRRLLFSMAEPMWKLENIVFDSNFFEYFKSKKMLINERQVLEQKLFLAGNLLTINNTLQKENESLKEILGRKEIKEKTVLASILVKPPQTPYDLLVIDIGEDYGVKIDDQVIANGNVYIGKISEVTAHSSKVLLYSSPNQKLSVVLGINSVSVEAVGMGGGNFSISLLRDIEVKEGDIIVIPTINTNVFGIVEKINFKDKDSFQTVFFKSPVNISELSFVEVVI